MSVTISDTVSHTVCECVRTYYVVYYVDVHIVHRNVWMVGFQRIPEFCQETFLFLFLIYMYIYVSKINIKYTYYTYTICPSIFIALEMKSISFAIEPW